MSDLMKKEIPLGIFILCTFWIFFEFFLNIPGGSSVTNLLGKWVSAVSNFALLLGALNIVRFHGKRVVEKRKGEWYHSILIVGSMLVMYAAGQFYDPLFKWLYDNIYVGLNVAIMCYVGFYFYSAMYRTFKVRSFEAGVTLFACISMLLANAPISGAIWGPLPQIGLWVADTPGMGAWRGFIMSAALGMFAMAIRSALGMERAFIGVAGEGD